MLYHEQKDKRKHMQKAATTAAASYMIQDYKMGKLYIFLLQLNAILKEQCRKVAH